MGFSAVNREEVRPKAKYAVIHRHRNEYSILVMCQFFQVSRSGYYDYVKRMGRPEKIADFAKEIQMCQDATDKTYGYRRIWLWLEHKKIHKNQKTVLRVMKKYALLSEIHRHRKWENLAQRYISTRIFVLVNSGQIGLTQDGLQIFLISIPRKVCYICP